MTYTALADLGVQNYGDPLAEASRCRKDSALFDFSFMRRVRITGSDALPCLNKVQSRDLSNMLSGDIHYCLSTEADGIVTADLTVWKISDDCYEIFAGRSREIDQISARMPSQVKVEILSDSTSIFAVQGPRSLDILSRLCDRKFLQALSYFQHEEFLLDGIHCRIGRLGYTGEKGFEIVIDNKSTGVEFWEVLASLSQPAGMSAIDILRIEAGFILFLNECRLDCNALELGLQKFSRPEQYQSRFQLVCFQARDQAIGMPWSPPVELSIPGIGEITVTSACRSTLFNGVLGLGFVRAPFKSGNKFIDPLNRFKDIKINDKPFYDPQKTIPRAGWTGQK